MTKNKNIDLLWQKKLELHQSISINQSKKMVRKIQSSKALGVIVKSINTKQGKLKQITKIDSILCH